MTFIPSVLSKTDNNNSSTTATSSFTSVVYTSTTGFNTLQINITPTTINNNINCNITIYFSPNSSTVSYTITDNFSSGNIFNKKYNIFDAYYKVSILSPGIPVIFSSRLCTDSLTPENNSVSAFDNNNEYKVDAFGKLRVTEPYTLLDLKFPVGPTGSTGSFSFLSNTQQICNAMSTGATGVYKDAKLVASVSGSNSYYMSQSRTYSVYQAGKSLLFMGSALLDGGSNGANVYTRIGYFDNYTPISTVPLVKNGMYFEYNGSNNGSISVNYSNNGTITSIPQKSTTTPQTSWNIDKMDGTGSSGIYLNFKKAQLFVIDMEWLSVGRVRFGFYIYGKIVYCHQLTNINTLTGPYTTEINLPVCYSIHSNLAGNTGSITQICSTVISEGGYQPTGKPFSIGVTGGVSVGSTSPSATPGERLILSLRGGSTQGNYNHQNIIPRTIDILDGTSGSTPIVLYRLRMYRDGNYPITSPTMTWIDVDSPSYSSVSQYSLSTGAVVPDGSIIVEEGLFSGKTSISFADLTSVFTSNLLQISSNISGTSDVLALTCQTFSSAASIYATISWNEYY